MSTTDLPPDFTAWLASARSRLRPIVQAAYDQLLRPHTPRTMGTMGGIPVPASKTDQSAYRILDATRHRPDYKYGLITAIHNHVDDGADVGLIGLGRGVTTVHTVREGGRVTAYEAAREMIDTAETTLAWQDLRDRVDIVHAVVETPGGEVYGDDIADTVPAETLTHDTLILDCEGAELAILPELDSLPKTVIVETHPRQDAPSRVTRHVLVELGYKVTARGYEPREQNSEKRVLIGQRGAHVDE